MDHQERLERGPGITKWRQIEARLASEIGNSAVEPGCRLPSETHLATRFGVNRHTVRRAIGALAARGLVSVQRGRGTFVEGVLVDYPIRRRVEIDAEQEDGGLAADWTLLDAFQGAAELKAAKALGIEPGTPLWVLRRLAAKSNVPLLIATTQMPAAFLPDAEALDGIDNPQALLRLAGIDRTDRLWTGISAERPGESEARHLRQSASMPVLRVDGVDTGHEGAPVRLTTLVLSSGRTRLVLGDAPASERTAEEAA